MDKQATLRSRESCASNTTAISVRKVEDSALLSSSPAESPFFNLQSRSLTLSGNPASWSNDEQVKTRIKGNNVREKRTRVIRSATPTDCYHQQSVNNFPSCSGGGGVAHSDETEVSLIRHLTQMIGVDYPYNTTRVLVYVKHYFMQSDVSRMDL